MKISCNVKQGTSLLKNSSQTVEIKDKTNEKQPYLEQNISNHKLDGSDKKANTNTSPEMKISCNVKQGTSLVKNSSQTVEIKDKTKENKPYLEQNISNHKLDGSNLDHSIKIFNNLLSKGPIYMCSVCQQTQSNSSAKSLLASLLIINLLLITAQQEILCSGRTFFCQKAFETVLFEHEQTSLLQLINTISQV